MGKRSTADYKPDKDQALRTEVTKKNFDLFVAGFVCRIPVGTKFTAEDVCNGFEKIGGVFEDENKRLAVTEDKLRKLVDFNFGLKLTPDGYVKLSDS